ncbi:MAG: YihY/virulence factor BrkB family protein [Chloroflexia bacterium]
MLPAKNWFNILKRSVSEFGKDDIGTLAAALAFAAFFSIFPLILFLVSLASFFLSPDDAQRIVVTNIPQVQARGDTGFFVKTVHDVIAARGASTGIAAVVGLVSLAFSATGVFGTLQKAINRAWHCETAGSLVKDKVIAFLMVMGVGLVILVSTVVSSLLNGIQKGTTGIIGDLPWLWQIVNLVVSLGLMAGVLTLLYHSLPRCKVNWGDVWPPALLVAIGLEILKQGFAFYLGNFANYQAVYGALGGIIALQTYILLASLVLLFGAEVCSEYANERQSLEVARATASNEAAARKREAARASRREARERASGERRPPAIPMSDAAARQTASVFAAAAGAAALIGALGKLLLGRGAHR